MITIKFHYKYIKNPSLGVQIALARNPTIIRDGFQYVNYKNEYNNYRIVKNLKTNQIYWAIIQE